ncbi:UNVERIFIED_CONTAM: hypothetical protein K2H54_049779 [Gekko kuhli]
MAAAAAPAAAAATTTTNSGGGGGSPSSADSGGFHQQLEPCLRKQPPRMDPRRRQAALSFLTNISLDGRPVLQDDEGGGEEPGEAAAAAVTTARTASLSAAACNSSSSARTRQGSLSAFPPPASLQHGGYPGACGGSARLRSPLGVAGEQQLQGNAGEEEEEEDEDEDAFASVQVPVAAAFLGSSGTPAAGGARGRLNSFTQGILPVSFARAAPQNYCCAEQGQAGTNTFELQRPREGRLLFTCLKQLAALFMLHTLLG